MIVLATFPHSGGGNKKGWYRPALDLRAEFLTRNQELGSPLTLEMHHSTTAHDILLPEMYVQLDRRPVNAYVQSDRCPVNAWLQCAPLLCIQFAHASKERSWRHLPNRGGETILPGHPQWELNTGRYKTHIKWAVVSGLQQHFITQPSAEDENRRWKGRVGQWGFLEKVFTSFSKLQGTGYIIQLI